jgi:hypothetical protein
MNKSTITAWSVAAAALLAAAWFHRDAARQKAALAGARAQLAAARAAPAAIPAPVPPASAAASAPVVMDLKPAGTITANGVNVQAYVAGSNAPAAPPELPAEVAQAMASFDRAMDKEFDRLETRESGDLAPAEQDLIAQLKAEMLRLDDIRARADAAATPSETAALEAEMQAAMGHIISLGANHRRQRLEEMARRAGYQTDEDIASFLAEIDTILRETQLDWPELFNRGP